MGNLYVRIGCAFVLILSGASVFALPPLGLTQITPTSIPANLEIIDGSAYLGVADGVWTVDSAGSKSFVAISHPTLGSPVGVTRVVKALDGELYVAANYRVDSFFNQPALYRLNQPTTPIVTWDFGGVSGVDSSLRSFGTIPSYGGGDIDFEATRFLLDGSMESLPYPPGSDSSNNVTLVISSTPKGYVLGDAGIPGTIGSSPLLWNPDGEFVSFIFNYGASTSVRDRNDRQGVNIGSIYDGNLLLKDTYYFIVDDEGEFFADTIVLVSHGDFVTVKDLGFGSSERLFGYFPGIIPDHPDRAMPLLTIFPELAAIDIDDIIDVAAVDGHIYMTLNGSDGLYLFGARDPSVVPEPATIWLLAIATLIVVTVRRRRFRGNC